MEGPAFVLALFILKIQKVVDYKCSRRRPRRRLPNYFSAVRLQSRRWEHSWKAGSFFLKN
jgi:hypothetical protein